MGPHDTNPKTKPIEGSKSHEKIRWFKAKRTELSYRRLGLHLPPILLVSDHSKSRKFEACAQILWTFCSYPKGWIYGIRPAPTPSDFLHSSNVPCVLVEEEARSMELTPCHTFNHKLNWGSLARTIEGVVSSMCPQVEEPASHRDTCSMARITQICFNLRRASTPEVRLAISCGQRL